MEKYRYGTYRKFGRTRDRNDVLSLSQNPCQRNLPSGGIIFLPDLIEAIRNLQDIGKVFLRVPRDEPAEIAIFKVIGGFLSNSSGRRSFIIWRRPTHIAASDETPSEGSVCDHLDPKFPRSLQESNRLVFDLQRERRVFYFNCRDRVDGVCPSKG